MGKSITEGCEAANPADFRWSSRRPGCETDREAADDIANHYDLGFEVVLWARSFDLLEWTEALKDGAFDVLDAMCEQPKAVESTKRALWAAYLKGAGPTQERLIPRGRRDAFLVFTERWENMCNSLKVDEKGRLKIPLTLLTTLKGPGTEFYVTSENGNSVRIYPMRVWNEVRDNWNACACTT